jgi:hypothetical protein
MDRESMDTQDEFETGPEIGRLINATNGLGEWTTCQTAGFENAVDRVNAVVGDKTVERIPHVPVHDRR